VSSLTSFTDVVHDKGKELAEETNGTTIASHAKGKEVLEDSDCGQLDVQLISSSGKPTTHGERGGKGSSAKSVD
jgi:hypothetical protein